MRGWIAWNGLCFAALAAGAVGYGRNLEPAPVLDVRAEAARLRSTFGTRTATVRLTLDGPRELIDPSFALPHAHRYSSETVRALHTFASTCEAPDAPTQPDLLKIWRWQAHLCGSPLPKGFFDRPPFMHPSGRSFAALAGRTDAPRHAVESGGSPEVLSALVAGAPIALGRDRMFLGISGPAAGPTQVTYGQYSRAAWEAFLIDEALVTSDAREGCALREGNVCWQHNRNRTQTQLRLFRVVIFGASCGIFAGLIYIALRRAREIRAAHADRVFVLRMLTHELRTPATALKLSLDTLRRDFDALPDSSQDAFGEIANQVSRLSRVIEGSSRYLQSEGEVIRPVPIPSINALAEHTLERYGGDVSLVVLPSDRDWRTDPYWFGIVLGNLVDNALIHGAQPVQVKLHASDSELIIVVQDGGKSPDKGLEELVRPFHSSKSSLGLGLAITRRILTALGGRLTYAPDPTRFSAIWRTDA